MHAIEQWDTFSMEILYPSSRIVWVQRSNKNGHSLQLIWPALLHSIQRHIEIDVKLIWVIFSLIKMDYICGKVSIAMYK